MSVLSALVLDTSSFIQGINISDTETRLYTTWLVRDEILENMALIRLDNWVQSGRITIKNPSKHILKHVLESSRKLGEHKALSDTDHSVIALALELSTDYDTTVISDDYSVQNLSDYLGIKHRGLATKGIKKRFQWINYCPGCRKQFSEQQEDNVCSICGTELKRKPGKKTSKHIF